MGGVCKRWLGRNYGLQILFFPWFLWHHEDANILWII
jgi:hypothetical protein